MTMTLNDVRFKPWRSGRKNSSTGYGLCVSKKYAQLFPKDWESIVVTICCKGMSETLKFNLTKTFWTTCPDIKNSRTKYWLELSGHINWEGKKPEFQTSYLGENKFKVTL